MKKITLCLAFIFSVLAYAQPGTLDTSFNAPSQYQRDGANNDVWSVVAQPDGKTLIGGAFTTYNGISRSRIARLNTDGSLDTSFDPGTGPDFTVYSIATQPDGKVLIGGAFSSYNGVSRNRIARLNADGSLDTGFNPGNGANDAVYSLVIQPDGKVLMGGNFTNYNGFAWNRIVRLNSNGSLDTSFYSGSGANGSVRTIALQPNGKVLIGGGFTAYKGSYGCSRIARLNIDGNLDASFNPAGGTNNTVFSIALQLDGKVLIGGDFTTSNTSTRNKIARLNADGSLDTGFDPGAGADSSIRVITLQPDGKILIGGGFGKYKFVDRFGLARLNANGSLDTGFDQGIGTSGSVYSIAIQSANKVLISGNFTSYDYFGCNRIANLDADGFMEINGNGVSYQVSATALQPDGKILIGGYFSSYNGAERNGIARLNANGTLDKNFVPGVDLSTHNFIYDIALQPDGKILLAITSQYISSNSYNTYKVVRLNQDGSLDTSFNAGIGADDEVFSMALQSDGKVLIEGRFTTYNGVTRNHIARLNADGSVDTSFNAGTDMNGNIATIALQPDGKILIAGGFTVYNGVVRNRLARLNTDGSLDTGFNSGLSGINDGFTDVSAIAVQPDGKVLIGGGFTTYNGIARNRIARLNSDGSLDASFDSGIQGNYVGVGVIALQPNGKILIGGDFDSYNGVSINNFACLNPDGSLDKSFDVGVGVEEGSILAITLQPDGKIIIGGKFNSYKGISCNGIARINGAISGNTTICKGSATQLIGSNTPATVNPWASSNIAVASINNSGLVTGISAGTTTITYTDSNGSVATILFTVKALPIAAISGSATIEPNTAAVITFTGTPNAIVSYMVNGSIQSVALDNSGKKVLTQNLITNTTYSLLSVTSSEGPSCSQNITGTATININNTEHNDCENFNLLSASDFGNKVFYPSVGIGNVQEINSCGGYESNSIWFKVVMEQSGTFGFDLIPEDTDINVNFDFWVFGPSKACGNLGTPIRCSTSNPKMSGLSNNHTGMNEASVNTTDGPTYGTGYVKWLTVNAGEEYYIVVDNANATGGGSTGKSSNTYGFKLQANGTAATLGNKNPIDGNATITMYPNPARSSIQISTQNTNENLKNIIIHDMLGKTVKSASNLTTYHTTIDVSNLAQGIYTVEITSENNLKLTKKLIIQ